MKKIFYLLYIFNSCIAIGLTSNQYEYVFPEVTFTDDNETLSISMVFSDHTLTLKESEVIGEQDDSGNIEIASPQLYEDIDAFYRTIFSDGAGTLRHKFVQTEYDGTKHAIPLAQNTFFIYEGEEPLNTNISTYNVADCVFAYFYSKQTNRIAAGHFDLLVTQTEVNEFVSSFCRKEDDSSDIVCRLVSCYVTPLLANFYIALSNQGISDIKAQIEGGDGAEDFYYMTHNDRYDRTFIYKDDIANAIPWNIVVDKNHNIFSAYDKFAENTDHYRNYLLDGFFYKKPRLEKLKTAFAGTDQESYCHRILEAIRASKLGKVYLNAYNLRFTKKNLSSLIDVSNAVNKQ